MKKPCFPLFKEFKDLSDKDMQEIKDILMIAERMVREKKKLKDFKGKA